jgi:hypothetical protein
VAIATRVALPAVLVFTIIGSTALLPGSVAADGTSAPTGFGGPTFDVPPVNAPPSYHHQNLPIGLRISADGQRIIELDWALIEACNFDARIDWGTVRDIPIAADGSFQLHTDYLVRGFGKTASLDISGHAGPDHVDGRTQLENPSDECGMTSTWRATPAFVGTTTQHTPAVMMRSADHRRISRLLLVWLPRCRDGTVLIGSPEDAIGIDQRHVARIGRSGHFRTTAATGDVQSTEDVAIARETVAGRLVGHAAAGLFRVTAGSSGTSRCTGRPIHFLLHA